MLFFRIEGYSEGLQVKIHKILLSSSNQVQWILHGFKHFTLSLFIFNRSSF